VNAYQRAMAALRTVGSYGLGLVFVFVLIGGDTYRMECLRAGVIEKEWKVTWMTPVPFVFRPSGDGCVVHNGLRVALNSIGVWTYPETTPRLIASDELAGDPEGQYLALLSTSTSDYIRRNESRLTAVEAFASVATYKQELAAMTPPEKYRQAHADLIDALSDAETNGHAIEAAARAGDQAEVDQLRRDAQAATGKIESALNEIDRIRIGG